MDGDLINLTGDGQPEEVEVKIVTGRAFLPGKKTSLVAAHAAVFTVTLMRPHSQASGTRSVLCSIPVYNRHQTEETGTPGVKQQEALGA